MYRNSVASDKDKQTSMTPYSPLDRRKEKTALSQSLEYNSEL